MSDFSATPSPLPSPDWGARMAEHREPLRKLITRRLAGEGDEAVDDILQEVAVAAHQSGESLPDSRQSGAWLRRVAIHKVQDYWRRIGRKRRLHAGLSEGAETFIQSNPSPSEWVMALENRSRLHAALKSLPQADRALLERKYLHNRSYEEIARETGLSLKSLEYRLSCARQALRNLLSREP